MLGSETMELSALNDEVNAQLNRQKQTRLDSEQAIRRIAGVQGKLDLTAPAWPETCFNATQLMQEDGRGQEAEQQINVAAANSQMKLLDGGILDSVEAGVQVSHSRMKDSPGQQGYNSGVYLDVAVPLGWKQVRDARVGEWSAKRQQAEASLQEARSLRQFDIDRGLRERSLLKSELGDAQTQLKASQESLRVANLRRPALEGDGIVDQFKARMAVYKASVRVVNAAEKYSLAEADLLALGPECPTQEQPASANIATPQLLASLGGSPGAGSNAVATDAPPPSPAASPTTVAVTAPVAQIAATPHASASRPNTGAKTPESPKTKKPAQGLDAMRSKIGWFVWEGQKLLDNPSRLDALPANTGRLLLSFSAEQLQKMRPNDWKELRARADKRGMRLELLLGDPGWVTSKGRPSLISLLKSVQGLPVDGLNLDLERSQLPKGSMTQERWMRETAATIREVRAATPWELALTTHPRDLDDPAFLAALRSAGLTEIVPMIYTQNAKRATELTERLLSHSSGLHVSLAQSIERVLTKEESSFHQGRGRSIQRWSALSKDLSRNPLFSGVIVQSMADYQEAKP